MVYLDTDCTLFRKGSPLQFPASETAIVFGSGCTAPGFLEGERLAFEIDDEAHRLRWFAPILDLFEVRMESRHRGHALQCDAFGRDSSLELRFRTGLRTLGPAFVHIAVGALGEPRLDDLSQKECQRKQSEKSEQHRK